MEIPAPTFMKFVPRSAALIAMLLSTGGCVSMRPTMTSFSVDYNRVVADTRNQMILLNIVRSAYREPTYYTAFSQIEGSLSLEASVSGEVANLLGGDATAFTPTVSGSIEDRIQSLKEQILSRSRLERIILDFDLYRDARETQPIESVIAAMRPAFRMATSSHTRSTSGKRCVEKNTVVLPLSSVMSSSTARRPIGSSAEVGSSSTKSCGALMSAWARPSRCRIPSE